MQRISTHRTSSSSIRGNSRGNGRGRGRGRGRGGRGGRFQDTTTHMPAHLLEELNAKDPDTRQFTNKVKSVSRKQQRKQQRQEKKQLKAAAHLNKRRRDEEDLMDSNHDTIKSTSIQSKKQKSTTNGPSKKLNELRVDNSKSITTAKNRPVEISSKGSLDETEAMREQIVRMATRDPSMYARLRKSGLVEDVGVSDASIDAAEALEEQMLRYYEKQLKIKKQKLPKSFNDDGLDFLLEDITVGVKHKIMPSTKTVKQEDAVIDDVLSTNSESEIETENEFIEMQDEMEVDLNTEDDDDDEESEDDDESDEEEDSNEDDESDEEEEDDDDVENESVSEDDEESIENNKSTDKTVITKNTETVTEQASAGKYVPPHLRHSEDARSAQLMKLRRQTQGQLNRLSEANIESIIAEIEGFYRNYPRRDVTDTVTDLVLNAIGLRSHLNDNFVVINAAFIASLYGVIGSEFGAQFVQTLVERFDTHHATLLLSSGNVDENDGDTTKGKECSNLIVLLTELYNFQVVSNVLLYDFIRHFIKHITETNVELLTKIIRLSGVQLRQEDPSALKEIVLELQKNLAQLDASKLSSRTKFMIEMIQDLKNNKVKKRGTLASQANATREIVTTLKKFIGNLNKKRHVVVSEPLNVSLLDIRSVKTKGKWWLVGASWVGNQVNGQHSDHEEHNISTMTTTTKTSKAQSDKTATDQLLALARKQNMNTDIRRSIFVILMSSEDYIDAFDRLIKLGLKEVQEREIARVLLHCCGQEKIFNPYYVLVAERVCSYKHGFKVTFQYALWDFLREMGEEAGGLGSSETRHRSHDNDDQVPMRRIVNVAKFYGWLMGANALSLVVLKTMTFTRIQASAQVFFRVLFAHLFLRVYTLADRRQDIDALTHVCSRATVVPALADGIRFFLHYFMRKIDFLTDAQDIKVVTWSVEMAREILKNTISSGGSREDQWEDNFN